MTDESTLATQPAREAQEPVAGGETCERCQGNGEIVTDWGRYLHGREGDRGDEAVAECPDCNGDGYALSPKGTATWLPIAGFEGVYEVSSLGDIRSIAKGKILTKPLTSAGYPKVVLWSKGARKQTTIHRIVAAAFLPKPSGLDEVNHIDGDKTNNKVSNLEWTTRSGNEVHSRYVLGNKIKPVLATDIEDGHQEYYPSIEEAARHGYTAAGIFNAITGRKKSHGGKTWAFTEWKGPPKLIPPDAAATIERLTGLLGRCRTVLGNMARENEGATFFRWPINHEPLRADAKNLLPLIDEEIGYDA